MMKAAVVREAGSPEVLKIESVRVPVPVSGEVLIRVRAFGLNRSEVFTRQGLSADVSFPRILGIEAVGTVASAPGQEFIQGETVATAMGGMGRRFDGSYAEYTLVSASQVQPIHADLPWATLGALPQMLQTVWGALFKALRLQAGERLLIRGGTTSIGLAAASIARNHGALVMSTTRQPECQGLLRRSGVDQVFIDSGWIAEQVHEVCPGGAEKVLELIGATTLHDSLRCAKARGIVCLTGMMEHRMLLPDFRPMTIIPTAVCLTTYEGTSGDFMRMPLDELTGQVAAGALEVQIGPLFHLDEIVEAHRCLENDRDGVKIVVLT